MALVDAVNWAEKHRHIKSASRVLKDYVSAVSVGVINGTPMLDLPYIEASQAMTDMNVAMTGSGTFIEIQGTAGTIRSTVPNSAPCLTWPKRATRNCKPPSVPLCP